jgi:hypothetical protein
LVASAAIVALNATPAHAALIFQGTFALTNGSDCATVQNNGTTDQTPIQLLPCNGSNSQRWAIYLATDTNLYWILAYGGAQPLNKCMDRGDFPLLDHMWIYGCHGGTQQRWSLNPTTSSPQWIRSPGTSGNSCVGVKPTSSTPFTLAIRACVSEIPPFPVAPTWALVPA